MICLEKMLNFDDFTNLKFFLFFNSEKTPILSIFFEKMLKFRILIIRNGNSTTTRRSKEDIVVVEYCCQIRQA